jgi:hypothetical protein
MGAIGLPRVVSVVLLAGVAIASSTPSTPARAASLPASIFVVFQNFDGGVFHEPTTPQELTIADHLGTDLVLDSETLFARTDGWRCLSSAKVRPKWVVQVGVVVRNPDPAVPDSVPSLSVVIAVELGRQSHSGVGSRTALPRGWTVGSMRFEANRQMEETVRGLLSRGIKPCEAKVKIRGQQSTTFGGVGEAKYAWQGEGSLNLAADGRFESTVPVRVQVAAVVRGCRGETTFDSQLDTTGSYREDGRLVFTKMWSPLVERSFTASCGTVNTSGSLPWGGSWMGAQNEVAVPLEDGTHVRRDGLFNPIASPQSAGEGTLELEYGRPGPRPAAGVARW